MTNNVIKGLYALNALYYKMCFEFEIPNKKKDKNLHTIDVELEGYKYLAQRNSSMT